MPVAVGVELGGDVGVGNRERGAGSARPGAGGVGARPAGGAAGPLGPVHHRLSCSDDIPDLASRTTSSRSAFGQRRSPTVPTSLLHLGPAYQSSAPGGAAAHPGRKLPCGTRKVALEAPSSRTARAGQS